MGRVDYLDDFNSILKVLNDLNLLGFVLLVGSWADFLYDECGVIADFDTSIKTTDIDFLVRNINKPGESVGLYSKLEEGGYLLNFMHNEVIKVTKGDFLVEFLARQIGKPEKYVDSPCFGRLPTLGHMSVLDGHTMTVDYQGFKLNIPHPVALTLHKMIINKDRSTDKKVKDTVAVKNLLFFLKEDVLAKDFQGVYDSLTKKEKRKVRVFCDQNGLDLHYLFNLVW